jgi:serine/threonine protein kinase
MTDRSGQQLGSYRLLRRLGSGAFAEVYLGEHRFLKSQAAIKILHTQILQEAIDKFLQEAQILARLRNPNIVQVYDFNQDSSDGTHFLVMDYAPHGCIRELHPKGSILPLFTVVTYVQQIAAALQQAHDEKIVHRDIKPENLLLGRNKEIILSDFGIAAVAQSTASWKTQGIAGTPYYMAPEQFRGKPQPASDQYALAVVVYEWLCGTPPFTEGDFIQLGFQHAFEPVPPMRDKGKTIAPEVEQVVMKALAKDPQQRFGSVREFAKALEETYKKQEARQQVPMSRGEARPRRPTGPSPEAQKRATEWLQSMKEEIAFRLLEKAYEAVRQGTVTIPDAIRDLADKFDAVARDPQKSKAFPYDAARAARTLYQEANALDEFATMRRPSNENINY